MYVNGYVFIVYIIDSKLIIQTHFIEWTIKRADEIKAKV